MQEESKQVPAGPNVRVQQVVVLVVLNKAESCSRVELDAELDHVPPLDITAALTCLQTEGVVALDGARVGASRCTRYLDALDMIAI
jgi:hypothetical protein